MKKFYILILTCAIAIAAAAQTTKETCPRDTVDGQIIYHYTVEKSIGLWRISQTFGVSQEAIIDANPQLKERGLHLDEVLLIPGESVELQPQAATAEEGMPITIEEEIPDTMFIETTVSTVDTTVESEVIRLALLLPLQASALQRDNTMDRFMDFYEGALLAINEIQAAGQRMEVYVYDIEKTDLRIRQIIADSLLNNMSAIIGPAYPIQVAHVAQISKQYQIPTLIPFTDQVSGIESNPYLMQFNATEQQKAVAIADYLQAKGDSINCVLIDAKDADIPQSIRAIRKEILTRNLPHTYTTIHKILVDSLGGALRDSVNNILIFNTERYGNLQVLMPRVLNAKGGRELTLLSQFSWQKENIVLPQLYTTVFSTDFSSGIEAYEQAFSHYYGHEHTSTNPRYDLLGYDLTNGLVAFLKKGDIQGIQSQVRPLKLGEEGGYINTHITVVSK